MQETRLLQRRRGMAHPRILAALLLLSLLVGCPKAAKPPAQEIPTAPGAPAPTLPPPEKVVAPEEGGEGTFALEDPFTTIRAPHLATASDRMIRSLAFHGLTRLGPHGKIEPELAIQWEMLRNGSEWVFHLRPDTVLSGGRYLEARHVVSSWEKVALAPGSTGAWLLEAVKGFDEARQGEAQHLAGLVLEDGLTLRVVLERSVRDLPARLAHPALGVSAFGEDEEGTGPYQIWGATKPQIVVLRSNPEYFRGLPHLDEIAFVRGEAASKGQMASGRLDLAVLAPDEQKEIPRAARLFAPAVGRTLVLGLNRNVPPFSSDVVARRFLQALDPEKLVPESWRSPRSLLEAPESKKEAPSTAATPAPVVSGLGRLDLVYPEADRGAALLAERIGALVGKGGGRVSAHPALAADLPGTLARGEFHLFIAAAPPGGGEALLRLEEMARWNPSVGAALQSTFRRLEAEADPAALAAGVSSLDRALREGGFLVPLATIPRQFLVGKEICGVWTDPSGTVDWTRLWRSRAPGGGCD